MKMTRRTGAKLQIKCNRCGGTCAPRDGDWQNGGESQVFVCHLCERPALWRDSKKAANVYAAIV